MDWISLLKNQSIILNGLAIVFAFITFVLLVLALTCNKRRSKLSLKLLGIFAVISLCYMANSTGVYGIGVFIIATSITTLDFLEKLAAIIWRNDKYWEYKAEELRQSFSKAKKNIEILKEEAKMVDTPSIGSDVDQCNIASDSTNCNEEASKDTDGSFSQNIYFIAGYYCNDEIDRLAKLAKHSPHLAIIEAWRLIEILLSELSMLLNLDVGTTLKRYSYVKLLKTLIEREVAPENLAEVINDLRKLRNEVAHGKDYLIDYEQAKEYIYMIAVALGVLHNAKKLLENKDK